MKKFISGLILAAGTSSRMGQPKQLLPFQGTILLDWVMAQAESASALDEVIVVLGRAADEIRPRLRNTQPCLHRRVLWLLQSRHGHPRPAR